MRFSILLVIGFFINILHAAGDKTQKVVVEEETIVIDRDQDGRISLAEYQEAQVEAIMREYDSDKDGVITKEEIASVNESRSKSGKVEGVGKLKFKQLDHDKNGSVSRQEIQKAVVKQKKTDWYFDTLDADKDAHISRIERPKDRPTVGGFKIVF
ncbi:EF-hand domain-containing protein [Kamptonema cortianum]|nr:EF-hand domain-containing protein [Kamptonema cortianum]MDL5044521.1 EF-hand domain-containing protein [Oscillatoria amoena NRMC-F 0135]